MLRISFFLLVSLMVLSCSKENQGNNCENLKTGIANNDINKVKSAINLLIAGLPDKTYTEININELSRRISFGCGLTVSAVCFDCIKTLPSQTEISITWNSGGVSITRIVDLSYDGSNKIIFRNMHD